MCCCSAGTSLAMVSMMGILAGASRPVVDVCHVGHAHSGWRRPVSPTRFWGSSASAMRHDGPMARRLTPAVVDFDEWLSNVHDVFMNAQLMRTLMDHEPVVHGAAAFMTSRRGRLERAAMRDLYVLIEAYEAAPLSVYRRASQTRARGIRGRQLLA